MGRYRSVPDPLATVSEPRWLVIGDTCSRPLRHIQLRPNADLRAALEAERQRLIADGWVCDGCEALAHRPRAVFVLPSARSREAAQDSGRRTRIHHPGAHGRGPEHVIRKIREADGRDPLMLPYNGLCPCELKNAAGTGHAAFKRSTK